MARVYRNGFITCSGLSNYRVLALSGIYDNAVITDLTLYGPSAILARFYGTTVSGVDETPLYKVALAAAGNTITNFNTPLVLTPNQDLRLAAGNTTEVDISINYITF